MKTNTLHNFRKLFSQKKIVFLLFLLAFTHKTYAQWNGEYNSSPNCSNCSPRNWVATIKAGTSSSLNAADTLALICSNTSYLTYKVFDSSNTNPVPSGGFNLFYSVGNSTTFTKYVTTSGAAISIPGSYSLQLISFSFLNPGVGGGQVRMYLTSGTGSNTRFSNIISFILMPNGSFSTPQISLAKNPICLKETTTATLSRDNDRGGLSYKYNWFMTNNTSYISALNTTQNVASITGVNTGLGMLYIKRTLTGKYNVRGFIDSVVCLDSSRKDYIGVTVNNTPTLVISGGKQKNTTCINTPFSSPSQISATLNTNGLNTSTYTYQWFYTTKDAPNIAVAINAPSSTLSPITPVSNISGYYKYFCVGNSSNSSLCRTLSDTTDWYRVIGVTKDTVTASVCSNLLPYSFAGTGIIFTSSGNKNDTIKTNNPTCDSIIKTYILTVKDTSASTTTLTVCDSIIWNGTKYTNSGIYFYHTNNSVGCDSTARLNLTVNQTSLTELTYHICKNTAFSIEDSVFSGTGVHYYVYVGSNGCDSIIKINLFDDLLPSDTTYRTLDLCVGQTFHGTQFQAGTYTFWGELSNHNGCDSIVVTTLIVHPKTQSVTDTFLCKGQLPFTWHGKNVTKFNNYSFITTNQWGCDSIVTLRVKEIKLDTTIHNASICESDSLVINGITYNQTGIFYIKYTSLQGCDSIVALHLTVNAATHSTKDVYICSNCTYQWNGSTYNTAGVYVDNFANSLGCDSTATLNLFKGTIDGPTRVCLLDTLCYKVYQPNPKFSYSWEINSSTTEIINQDTSCFQVLFTAADTVPLVLSAFDSINHLVYKDTISVIVSKSPAPIIKTMTRVGCQNFGSTNANEDVLMILNDSSCAKVCEGSYCTYFTSGPASSTYKWKVYGGTIVSQNLDSVKIRWGAVGSGNLIVEEINTSGCRALTRVCVDIIKKPNAYIYVGTTMPGDGEPLSITICRNQQITFVDASRIDTTSPIVKWYWNFGDGNHESSTIPVNPSHTFTTPGTFIVILTVSNQCNCTSTASYKVIVRDTSSYQIECKGVVCDSSVVKYYISGIDTSCTDLIFGWGAIGGTIDYTQSSAKGDTVAIKWDNIDSTGYGTITFNSSVCPNNLCPAISSLTIPVIKTQGKITGSARVCPNSSTLYRLPLWAGTTYNWSTNIGALVHTDNPNEIALNVGNISKQTITLTCTYHNALVSCGGNSSITIDVDDKQDINVGGNYCQYDTASVSLSNTPNSSWVWTVVYPNDSIVKFNGGNPRNIYLPLSGTYAVLVSGASVCPIDPAYINVTKAPGAPENILGTDTVCERRTYFYEVKNPKSNLQYHWSVGSGVAINGDTSGQKIEVQFTGNGPWIISVSASNLLNPNCVSTTTTKTIYKETLPQCSLVNFNSQVCPDTRVTYQASYTKGDSYQWTITPSSIGSIESGGLTNTPTIVWNHEAGSNEDSATISVIIRKCDTAIRFNYTVYFHPQVSVSMSFDSTVCRGTATSFTLTSSTPLSGANINWNFGDGTQSSGNVTSVTHIYSTAITSPTPYTVYALISNLKVGQCFAKNIDTIFQIGRRNITVLPRPKLTSAITYGHDSCNGVLVDTIVSFSIAIDTAFGAVDSLRWTTPSGISTSYAPNLVFTPTITGYGIYTATAYNQYGCPQQISIRKDSFSCPKIDTCRFDSLPKPTVSLSDTVGHCGSIYLTGSHSAGGFGEQWQYDGSKVTATTTSTIFSGIANTSGEIPVTYSVQFLDDSGKVCAYTATRNVIVPLVPRPRVDFTCLPDSNGKHMNVIISNNAVPYPSTTSVQGINYVVNGNNYFAGTSPFNYTTNTTLGIVQMGSANNIALATLTYKYNSEWIGCPTDTIRFAVPDPIDVKFTTNRKKVCAEIATVNFANTTIGSYNNPVWDFGDQTSSLLDPITAKTYSAVTSTTTYTVTLTVLGNNGCTGSYSQDIIVAPNNMVGNISPSGTVRICPGLYKTLLYDRQSGSTPNYFELFNTLHQPYSIAIDNSTINGFSYNTYGNYWIRAYDTTSACWANTRYSTTIIPISFPEPKIICKATNPVTTDTLRICAGNSFTLELTNMDSKADYNWYETDNTGTTLNQITQSDPYKLNFATGLPMGTYYYKVMGYIYNPQSCERASRVFVVDVLGKPDKPIINSPTAVDCNSYTIQLSVNNPQNVGTYIWSNGKAGSSITINEGGPYKVWYTNSLGCSNDTQIIVPYNPKDYLWVVPNGCYSGCLTPPDGSQIDVPHIPMYHWQWYVNTLPLNGGFNSNLEPVNVILPGSYTLLLDNGLCQSTSDPVNFTVNRTCAVELQCNAPTISVTANNINQRTAPPLPVDCDSFAVRCSILNNNHNQYVGTMNSVVYFVNAPWTTGIIASGVATSGFSQAIINIPHGIHSGFLLFSFVVPQADRLDTCVHQVPFSCNDTIASRIVIRNSFNLINSGIQVVPNPASKYVNVTVDRGIKLDEITILDLYGRSVLKSVVPNKESGITHISLESIAKGLYFVVVKTKSGELKTTKLVVE